MEARFIDDAVRNDRRIKPLTIVCKSEADITWYKIPNTEWQDTEVQRRIREAKTWYDKYCIHLTFNEFSIDPTNAKHQRAQVEINKLVLKYNALIARINRAAADKEYKLFRAQAYINAIESQIRSVIGRNQMLVLFVDEWYVKTGVGRPTAWRENRVSATKPDALTVGIDRYDRGRSTNILTHELTHSLRNGDRNTAARCRRDFKRTNGIRRRIPKRKWHDHYAGLNQDKAMSRPNRARAFTISSNPSSDVLSVAEYLYIQKTGYVTTTPGCDCRKKKEKKPKPKKKKRRQ